MLDPPYDIANGLIEAPMNFKVSHTPECQQEWPDAAACWPV
jgi:hypothetical protein